MPNATAEPTVTRLRQKQQAVLEQIQKIQNKIAETQGLLLRLRDARIAEDLEGGDAEKLADYADQMHQTERDIEGLQKFLEARQAELRKLDTEAHELSCAEQARNALAEEERLRTEERAAGEDLRVAQGVVEEAQRRYDQAWRALKFYEERKFQQQLEQSALEAWRWR